MTNEQQQQWQCSECASTNTWKRAKGLCRKCYRATFIAKRYAINPRWRADESKASYQRNRTKALARTLEQRRALKWEVLEALGGKCACCGETMAEFLTVDHINGDGAAHRKQLTGKTRASSIKIYRDIRKRGFPKDQFRVLCFNCNCAIGSWGYCPHAHTRTTKYPQQLRHISAEPVS